MKLIVSETSPSICRAIGSDPNFHSAELFTAPANGHRFEVGQVLTLVGLVDFREYNGTQVEVSAIREDGSHGRCYYVKGEINAVVNWIYEYRLQPFAVDFQI